MKLNIGSGPDPLLGYVNIDAEPPADYVGDIRAMNFHEVEEILMIHSLEHLPYRDVPVLLQKMKRWLVPDGVLCIEVPDMAVICQNPHHPHFQLYTYGVQTSGGEIHMSGYTLASLTALLIQMGFYIQQGRAFLSTHPNRVGMPCVEVIAHAPRSLSQESEAQRAQISSAPCDEAQPVSVS